MSFLDQLFHPTHHCEDAAIHLCRKLQVRISNTTLKKELLEHPDYPSLVSIGDVLSTYGVANQGLKLAMDYFGQLPLPFVAYVKSRELSHPIFTPVYAISEKGFEIYNPETGKVEQWDRQQFGKNYLGTIMLVEANENSGEKDYETNVGKENRKRLLNYVTVFALPLLVLLCSVLAFVNYSASVAVVPVVFTWLTLIGCAVSTLLLWHEVDEYNPALKQVCQAGTKVNCSAVLDSDGAKIFGLSWSSIGFCYFAGMLFALLAGSIVNAPVLVLAGWLNVLALPYVAYSIYYQWKVARQWCLLCLIVQGVLLLQFGVALAGGFHQLRPFTGVPVVGWLTLAAGFVVVGVTVSLLLPALEKAKESRGRTIELQRLKHNPQVFEALLTKQKLMEHPTDGLGISLGNPTAKYKLVKVCNPYCGPCSTAHPIMEELIEHNSDIQLQIIFTATTDPGDTAAPTVRHLLAIAAKGDEARTKKALDDWYLPERKDYQAFAEKYPLNGELQEQDNKILKMREWCKAMDVVATPTFFVSPVNGGNGGNGAPTILYKLPRTYTVSDLKHFFMI